MNNQYQSKNIHKLLLIIHSTKESLIFYFILLFMNLSHQYRLIDSHKIIINNKLPNKNKK